MYHAHQTVWLGAGFVVCALLFIVFSILVQFRKRSVLNIVRLPLFLLALFQILVMVCLLRYDTDRMRRELKAINPLSVSNLVLWSEGNVRRVPTNAIPNLLHEIQGVEMVSAHHSHPTGPLNMKFESNGQEYQYRIGRDSDRPNEYWVFETARAGNPGREIGRIESPSLGDVLNSLAHSQAPRQR